ncbi:YqhG family protein [Staphylospora marina]|uniref:YqhG family protein n=1 Tax=Staphylospora marina TaxID=2490858 RepID=UPI000F5BDAE5|nr:YqhG family protein [Staphylospora marina]
MDQQSVRSFTERYLKLTGCRILESAPSHLVTQLTIEADKDLLNRPFYWMYVEKMNLPPQPQRLCLVFDPDTFPEGMRGEYLFWGTPRFSNILKSARKQGRFVRLYQIPETRKPGRAMPYIPWVGVNFMISYICDRKRDEIRGLGINLVTGKILPDFDRRIRTMNWSPTILPGRHVAPPRLTVETAVGKLEARIQDEVERGDLTWADEAQNRLREELELLEAYYPEEQLSETRKAEREQRRRETILQYHPRIEVSVVNAGLFYMEKEKTDG